MELRRALLPFVHFGMALRAYAFWNVHVLLQEPVVDLFILVPHAVLCSVSATEWPPAELHDGMSCSFVSIVMW